MDSKVVIDAFNPYEARFPNRIVLTKEELHLIKALRSHGIDYHINSKHKSQLYILSKKNFESLLTDPIFLTVYSISIGVVAGFIKDAFTPSEKLKERLFIKNTDGEIFDYEGNSLDKNVINNVTNKMLSEKQSLSESLTTNSPYHGLHWSVHLEHTHEIVGWCNLIEDEVGLKCDPMKITCDKTWERIKSGELQGFSVAGMIAKSICNICDSDYTVCNHISGTVYDAKECCCLIHQFDLAEVSIVKNPANKLANISLWGSRHIAVIRGHK